MLWRKGGRMHTRTRENIHVHSSSLPLGLVGHRRRRDERVTRWEYCSGCGGGEWECFPVLWFLGNFILTVPEHWRHEKRARELCVCICLTGKWRVQQRKRPRPEEKSRTNRTSFCLCSAKEQFIIFGPGPWVKVAPEKERVLFPIERMERENRQSVTESTRV